MTNTQLLEAYETAVCVKIMDSFKVMTWTPKEEAEYTNLQSEILRRMAQSDTSEKVYVENYCKPL